VWKSMRRSTRHSNWSMWRRRQPGWASLSSRLNPVPFGIKKRPPSGERLFAFNW